MTSCTVVEQQTTTSADGVTWVHRTGWYSIDAECRAVPQRQLDYLYIDDQSCTYYQLTQRSPSRQKSAGKYVYWIFNNQHWPCCAFVIFLCRKPTQYIDTFAHCTLRNVVQFIGCPLLLPASKCYLHRPISICSACLRVWTICLMSLSLHAWAHVERPGIEPVKILGQMFKTGL